MYVTSHSYVQRSTIYMYVLSTLSHICETYRKGMLNLRDVQMYTIHLKNVYPTDAFHMFDISLI